MLTNLPSPGFNYHRLLVTQENLCVLGFSDERLDLQHLVCFHERAQMCATVRRPACQVIPDKSHITCAAEAAALVTQGRRQRVPLSSHVFHS